MADIFLSYASDDREKASELAEALAGHGWSVWWDRKIPLGQAFDAVIEKALTEAKCVIVLWSSHSVKSQWVRNEASAAEARGILLPIFVEEVAAPLAFRLLNGADLHDWRAEVAHPEFDELIERISELTGPTPGKPQPSLDTRYVTPPPQSPPSDGNRFAWRVAGAALAVVGIAALLFWTQRQPPAVQPGQDEAGTGAGAAATIAGEPSSGAASETAKTASIETPPAAEASQRDAGAVATGIGQISMNWTGAGTVGWKVLDMNRKVLRDTAVGPNSSRSEDLLAGDYFVQVGHPEFPLARVTVKAGEATVHTPAVGQIALTWNGAGVVGWKVLDANKKTIRDTATGPESTRSEDVVPGTYTVVVGHSEYPTTSITVKAGTASAYTPPVGRITLNWSGANVVGWKVLDANKKAIRDTATGPKSSRTEDVLPGRYVVVLSYPEFPPIPVTVNDGDTVAINR